MQAELSATGARQSVGAALQTDILEDGAKCAIIVLQMMNAAFILGGLGALADGIRRRVQDGEFVRDQCLISGDMYGTFVDCDDNNWDARQSVALTEIIGGSVLTTFGLFFAACLRRFAI